MRLALALPILSCTWLPVSARAYSDSALFALPVSEAGGGGRYYTGSPADPLSCDSCHHGATPPRIELLGLPSRYVPRATYELRVKWPKAIEHAASVIEVTDSEGRGAGTLVLPDPGSFLPEELCEPADAQVLAGQIEQADLGRMIASSPDCGQSMLRVQWTAPAEDVGPVWVAGALVAADHDGNFSGDGVTTFAEPLPSFGSDLPDVTSRASCSAGTAPTGGRQRGAWGLLAFASLLITIRRAASRMQRQSGACRRSDPTTRGGG